MTAIIRGGSSGANADVDVNGNLRVSEGIPGINNSASNYYTVAGGPAGIVAAGLAADVTLMSMRLNAASSKKAYLHKYRFVMSPATLGAAGGVAGVIGLQRFSAANPSGGTARTPCELNEPLMPASDMNNVQDLATALTVTSVVFGAEIGWTRVPLFVASAGYFEWIFEPVYPICLQAGDGIALRTRVAMAATQTWVFAYTAHWLETTVVLT